MGNKKEWNEGFEEGFRRAVINIANAVDVKLCDRDEIVEFLDKLMDEIQ